MSPEEHVALGEEALVTASEKSPGAPAGDYWHDRAAAHFLAAAALVAMAAHEAQKPVEYVIPAGSGRPMPPLAKGGKR